MQLYELLFIIIPSISDAELDKTNNKLLESMKKEAGELIVKDKKILGRKKFTYPIKHLTEGNYVLIDFESETEHIQSINRALELDDDVLRHIIVKKQIKSAEQIVKEEKIKEEMAQIRAHDSRDKKSAPQEKLVQKSEELPNKKTDTEVRPEELDEKLDEILNREIS